MRLYLYKLYSCILIFIVLATGCQQELYVHNSSDGISENAIIVTDEKDVRTETVEEIEENNIETDILKMDDDNMKVVGRKVRGVVASYTQIERDDDYCLDYFRKIDETYSYSRIVDEVGERNGLVGSGVSNPYWIVDDKYVLVIWGSDHENILKVVLCDQDKEIEDFYVKHKK